MHCLTGVHVRRCVSRTLFEVGRVKVREREGGRGGGRRKNSELISLRYRALQDHPKVR